MALGKFANRIVGSGEEPLDQIQFNPRNWRVHPLNQQNALKGVLEEVGWVQEVIVNKRTGNLIDGHLRCQLAAREGAKTIPVKYVDLSEDEEALVLSTLDPIAAMAVTDKAKLDDLFASIETENADVLKMLDDIAEKERLEYAKRDPVDAEPQIDRAAELNEKWQVVTGDLWQIGEHRLLCGDSTKREDVERVMAGEKARLVFTSPPYADIRTYTGDGDLSPRHLSEFISVTLDCVELYAINLGLKREDGEIKEYWQEYINTARSGHLRLLAWNVWSRHGFGGSVGNMTAMFPIEHEWVLVFGKEVKEINCTVPNKQGGKIVSATVRDMGGNMSAPHTSAVRTEGKMGSVFVSDFARGEKDHPAMFPVEFPEAYIEACSNSGEIVYEPFCGSGTTMVACQNLNRKCRAIEISPNYCAVILERMSTAFPELEIKRLA